MSKQWNESTATAKGLYDPRYEHDNCGIGAVVNIKGIKTHETVENALKIVENLKHRAGKDADGKTGDGVGILLQISHKFFKKVTKPLGIDLGDERDYGVGMFFFPNDEFKTIQAKKMLEVIVEKEGLEFLGWREVPTEPDKLSKKARDCMPCIMQCFVKRPEDVERGLEFDRKLYVARRVFEQSNDNTYVVSFSSRTIVYKGMFLVEQLRQFFMDLQDPDYESAIATVHSRFSTNTNPSWERSHPNRFIVHNGEINTILGNSDKMSAREENMESPKLKKEFQKVLPVINAAGSDSAMLDNALEFLVMSGMELPLAVMIMIPEPWANNSIMTQKKKDFYQYYATMMEPWDGPASIVFSDGDLVGAVLDRNGLRPSRYYVTDDDYLILSSEVGVLEIDPTKIVKKDRLRPGKMLLVDTVAGKIIDDDELKERYADKQPYGEWIASQKKDYRFKIGTIGEKKPEDWIVVEGQHEPLIDRMSFDIVQNKLKSRQRPGQTNEISLFAGLIKCGECGKSLTIRYTNAKHPQQIYSCKTYNAFGKNHCTQHRLDYDTLYSHVLRKIRECARAALMDGEAVADRLTNTCEAEQREQREAMERSLTRDEERIEVLDKMVMRLYEDMIAGRISEQNFNTMLEKTQTEQAELKAKVSEGRKRLSNEVQLANDAKQWVEAIQEYANITELDAATLNRLIKEIVVHERIDEDKTRHISIEIHFNLKPTPEVEQVTP